MAIVFKTVATSPPPGNWSATVTVAVAVGDLMVLSIGGAAGGTTTASDTFGSSWTISSNQIGYAFASQSGNCVITITNTTVSSRLMVAVYGGVTSVAQVTSNQANPSVTSASVTRTAQTPGNVIVGSMSIGSQPAGFSVTATDNLRGIVVSVPSAGNFQYNALADSTALSASQPTSVTFTALSTVNMFLSGLELTTPSEPPVIQTSSLPAGKEGVAYSKTIDVSGGLPPYTATITAGALPDGLTLSGLTISGTPTEADDFSFTIEVCGHDLLCDTATFTLLIMPAVQPRPRPRWPPPNLYPDWPDGPDYGWPFANLAIAVQATMFDRTALPTHPKPWVRQNFDPSSDQGCDQFKTDHSPPGDNDWLANLCWIYRDAKAIKLHQVEIARRAAGLPPWEWKNGI